MKNSQFTLAGKLANSRPVYFGKKDSSDPDSHDLSFWVCTDPHKGDGANYLRLSWLGFNENLLFQADYSAFQNPKDARAAARRAYYQALSDFLASLDPDFYEAWENSQILESMGEPFPDVAACIAAGQAPHALARSTGEAIKEILECENLTA